GPNGIVIAWNSLADQHSRILPQGTILHLILVAVTPFVALYLLGKYKRKCEDVDVNVKDEEFEADREGMYLPVQSGYSPFGAVDLSERLAKLLDRSEEHTSELQSQSNLVCRLLLEKKKNKPINIQETT